MDRVYEGMIVGENSRGDDMLCNPTKRKQLGNYRSSTKDLDAGLKVARTLTLEEALEWIAADELVEVTPSHGAGAQAHPELRGAQEGRQESDGELASQLRTGDSGASSPRPILLAPSGTRLSRSNTIGMPASDMTTMMISHGSVSPASSMNPAMIGPARRPIASANELAAL